MTSGHRVGSRWIHYLLADITGQSVSPEKGLIWLTNSARRGQTQKEILGNKLVKFHGVLPQRILSTFPKADIKVIAIVRNPRDRAVSHAFHNRYHDKTIFRQRSLPSDFDAVKYTVYKDRLFRREAKQQFQIMIPELSTRNYSGGKKDFVWTCYEWLKEDTEREIKKLFELAKIPLRDSLIKAAIKNNSFKVKSQRKEGEENRKDLWRRKGVNGDWVNWFDEKMVKDTQEENDRYYELLSVSNGDNNEN